LVLFVPAAFTAAVPLLVAFTAAFVAFTDTLAPLVAPHLVAFTAVPLLVPPFVAPLAFTAVHLLVLPSHLVGSLVAAKDRQLNYEDDGTPLCMS
jgi:hypothetical protein